MVFQMDYIAWIWLSILYCVMVIIALILILVTCIDLWYHDLAVIIIWTWLYLILCIDVPLLWLWSSWSILIGFSLLRENRGSHSHHCFGLLVLASSFIVSTHPLPSSFVSNPTYYLTYGREDLFPARTFVGQTSLFIVCLGSKLVTELAFWWVGLYA